MVIALAGCEGSTVTGYSRSCRGAGGTGRCAGRIASLSGIQRGPVLVSVTSPDDTVTTVEAAPQPPAVLEGIADAGSGNFAVRFEAVDGSATGLTYTVEYEAL